MAPVSEVLTVQCVIERLEPCLVAVLDAFFWGGLFSLTFGELSDLCDCLEDVLLVADDVVEDGVEGRLC